MPRKVKTKVGFPAYANVKGFSKEIEVNIPDNEPEPWGLDAQLKHVGNDTLRVDGVLKVTGNAKYTYDQHPKGMLWGKMLHAPWGAATIKALDTSAAKKIPGVRAIHIFKDVGRPLLYHGDEILAVAADSEDIAEDAIRAIKVTYERKPVVTTIADSVKADAPMVFAGEKNFKEGRKTGEKEKAEAAIKGAARVFEATYETQVQTHTALETHGAMAQYEKDGSLTVFVSTQATFQCHGDAVKIAQLPDDKVRIVSEMVGGGFGGKFNLDASGRAAIELAKKTKKPVKLMLNREGEHTTGGCRPASLQKMRAGVDKNGKVLGYTVDITGTGGVSQGGLGAANPAIYKLGDTFKQENAAFTNGGPSMAMRSPAWPQGVFAMEGFLDEMAHALNLDPLEFRKRNNTDEVYAAQWDLGAQKIGWGNRNKVPGGGRGVIKRGMGMASSTWRQMGGPKCEVDVVIHGDGTVEAFNGAQDIGTGTRTLMAVIVAEELGLKPEQIKVSLGNTTWPIGPGSGGSRTAPSIGPAARTGAFQAKNKLLALAAPKLGVEVTDLRIENGLVAGRGKSMSFAEACKLIPAKSPIRERGVRAANYDNNEGAYMRMVHGVQFAEVEVDTETGFVKVTKIVTVQDGGRVIDKILFESQLIGGAIQGISYALHENRILDRHYGPQVNADMMMYKISGPREMPEIIPIAFNVANAGNNCGMMGVGEPPNIPTAAAIGNALFNAIGVRLRSLPFTPDKVLMALNAAKGSKSAAI